MATISQRGGPRFPGEQALRDTWRRVGRRTAHGMSRVGALLVGYPGMVQGVYFFLTGVWPLVEIDSFQAVTGPKADLWLVRTVGILVAVVGAALCLAAYYHRVTPEVRFLALGSAAGLAAIDFYYVITDVISPIYLLDAALEIGLIYLWVSTWKKAPREPAEPVPRAVPVNGAGVAAPPPA